MSSGGMEGHAKQNQSMVHVMFLGAQNSTQFIPVYKRHHFLSANDLHFLLQWSLLLAIFLFTLGNASILVLLILRDEIVHVGLGLGEFHFVHTFTSVPMQE